MLLRFRRSSTVKPWNEDHRKFQLVLSYSVNPPDSPVAALEGCFERIQGLPLFYLFSSNYFTSQSDPERRAVKGPASPSLGLASNLAEKEFHANYLGTLY